MKTMGTLNDKTVEHLQDLIRINIDSCKGFEEAADKIESDSVARLFRDISSQRKRNAEQLRGLVSLTDEEAEDSGSIKGTVHRWWLSMRGTVTGGNEHTVLADAERGEDAIKERYEDALEQVHEAPALSVLRDQFVEVKRGHDTVRDLRDAAAK